MSQDNEAKAIQAHIDLINYKRILFQEWWKNEISTLVGWDGESGTKDRKLIKLKIAMWRKFMLIPV